MFNASWIAPRTDKATQILSNTKNLSSIQDYQSLLPQLPTKPSFLCPSPPRGRIKELFPRIPQYSFKEIFHIDDQNKKLEQNVTHLKTRRLEDQLRELQYEIQSLKIQNQQLYIDGLQRKRIISLDERLPSRNTQEMKKSKPQHKPMKGSHNGNVFKNIKNEFVYELENQTLMSNSYQYIDSTFLQEVEEKKKKKKEKEKIQKTLKKKKTYQRYHIKPVFIAVYAALSLSKKVRQVKEQQVELYSRLQEKLQQHQEGMINYPTRQIPIQIRQYFNYVTQKVVYTFKSAQFISEAEQMPLQDDNYRRDLRKLYVYKLSILLLQNLELYTRKGFLPSLLHHEININLFEEFHTITSKFVGERSHFLSETRVKVQKQQLLLIGLEYFIFQLFIPQLLEIVNELYSEKVTKNTAHISECQFYACVFACLAQKKVTSLFSKLKKIKNPNGKIQQRQLNVIVAGKNVVKTTIQLTDTLNEDENLIIEGLISPDLITALETEKPTWKEDVNQYFVQIILNIGNQIDV